MHAYGNVQNIKLIVDHIQLTIQCSENHHGNRAIIMELHLIDFKCPTFRSHNYKLNTTFSWDT